MNNFKMKLKIKSLNKKGTTNTYIQPFTQMPSVNNIGLESTERMDAHDLFSHYTVEIIKEDIVYAR